MCGLEEKEKCEVPEAQERIYPAKIIRVQMPNDPADHGIEVLIGFTKISDVSFLYSNFCLVPSMLAQKRRTARTLALSATRERRKISTGATGAQF